MIAIIKTIDGIKRIIKVTADVGAGNPVGSYLYLEKKSNPQGYLYCDGSTFDETKYPLLYAYLGSNVLPDWRELGAKGAEKNTTLIFDSTETDPSTGQAGTQNHDVFAQGEFKDDQLQDHIHNSVVITSTGTQTGAINVTNQYQIETAGYNRGIATGRKGTVTRGKSRAVFIYIKATSGLSENAQDNVINTLNEQNSYSETEHPTGRKWIDGKPTYTITKLGNGTFTNSSWTSITFFDDNVSKHIVNVTGLIFSTNIRVNGADKDFTNTVRFAISDSTTITTDYQITLEYTKTTD